VYTTEICTGNLQNAGPGPSLISSQAYHEFLFNGVGCTQADGSVGACGGVNALYWTWNDDAWNDGLISAFSNYLMHGGGGWSWNWTGDLYEGSLSGVAQTYRFDQYRNSSSAGWGGMSPSPYQGQVCSTYLAGQSYGATGWGISDKAYDNICYTASLVRDSVKNVCNSSLDWFQDIFVSCPASANKVTNCFLDVHQCGRDDRWYASHCGITATSISPDRLINFGGGNYGGGIWTDATGAPYFVTAYFSGSWTYSCWKN